MAWDTRLRPVIRFSSPSGLVFTPLWRGDEISGEKRLGRFAYPNVDKEVIQDLGMNSRYVPFTIYFDGVDNDKNSRQFEAALFERGIWQVTHPVDGLLALQLVSYKRLVEPVENGNITTFETEWIEPAENEVAVSVDDPASSIEAAVYDVNEATSIDLLAIEQNTAAQTAAVANTARQGMRAVGGMIQNVNSRVDSIQAQINELLNQKYLDIASVSGAVIALVETPALMLGSLSSKITMFVNLGRRIISDLPQALSFSLSVTNSALTGQLFLNAINCGMGRAIVSTEPETRREALVALAEYQRFTRETQAALERVAALTAGSNIEKQFVVRANSGEAIATLNAAVARYLISVLFDLRIERIIVLDRPRASSEIAVTEYAATAENADYYYEFFCRTNGLNNRELMLLPTGRQVVVYG